MTSFEDEFKEPVQLAKLLELKWFDFYTPTVCDDRIKKSMFLNQTCDTSEHDGKNTSKLTNGLQAHNIRGQHWMPFLRRNLSYIRDEIQPSLLSTLPSKTKPIHVAKSDSKNSVNQKHSEYRKKHDVTKSGNISNVVYDSSLTHPNPSSNGLNDQSNSTSSFSTVTHYELKEENMNNCDEDEEVNVTMISSSCDGTSPSSSLLQDEITTWTSTSASHPFNNELNASDNCTNQTINNTASIHCEQGSTNSTVYNPLIMGPPKEFKSHFALFSKHNREKARQLLPKTSRRNKEEVRQQILRMWGELTSSEVEYWTQQQEKDRTRYYLQRKMYFQALSCDDSSPAQSQQSSIHSNSSVLYTRSSDVFTCKTNKTSKIFYHYKYLHDKNTPALQIEMRKDFICPFCFFCLLSCKGLIIHLKTFHHDLMFQFGHDEESNLHITTCRNSERLIQTREHLLNFSASRQSILSKSIKNQGIQKVEKSAGSIFYIKRSHKKAGNINSAIRRKKIQMLKELGLEKDAILRFRRSEKIPIRQYYRSRTNLPMHGKDWDHDSDDDSDDKWFQRHMEEVTNEFEDVSSREKEFMIYWNSYIQSHTTISDRSLPQRCIQFIESVGEKLIKPDVRQDFLIHLFNLWDNGLISSAHITNCTRLYDDLYAKMRKERM